MHGLIPARLCSNESQQNFRALFNARHPNTFDNFLTIVPPEEILQLGNPWYVTGKLQNIIWMSRETNRKHMLIDALPIMKLLLWAMTQDQHALFWAKTFTSNLKGLTTNTKTKMDLTPSLNFSMSRSRTFTRTSCKKLKTSARRTPPEYTQHYTVNIQNLYYFNDDCTGVRTRS